MRCRCAEVWTSIRMKNQFSSSVLHDGYIYGLDEAILACIDASTGDLKWKGGRYGYGQVMLASGHLIVLTDDGDLALVRGDARAARGTGSVPRPQRQDMESPGDGEWLSDRAEPCRDGGVRLAHSAALSGSLDVESPLTAGRASSFDAWSSPNHRRVPLAAARRHSERRARLRSVGPH